MIARESSDRVSDGASAEKIPGYGSASGISIARSKGTDIAVLDWFELVYFPALWRVFLCHNLSHLLYVVCPSKKTDRTPCCLQVSFFIRPAV